jgi:hypothetical protein
MVLTVLYAGAVPGGIAGGELTSKIQGATTKHVTEVVAFEAK